MLDGDEFEDELVGGRRRFLEAGVTYIAAGLRLTWGIDGDEGAGSNGHGGGARKLLSPRRSMVVPARVSGAPRFLRGEDEQRLGRGKCGAGVLLGVSRGV